MNAQTAPQAGPYEDIGRWIDAHHPEQIEFLREIVKVPSDTPPGDNAPAAEKAAALLTAMNFNVERHPVPDDFLRGYGMRSVTNLIVRQRFGSGGPTVALNAHGIDGEVHIAEAAAQDAHHVADSSAGRRSDEADAAG